MTKEKYLLKWGEKYSTLIVDMFARLEIDYPDIIDNNISDYITYVLNRKIVKALYSLETMEEINRRYGVYFLKKSRINKLLNDYDRIIGEYDKLTGKFNNIIFSKISDKKLYDLFKEYVQFMEKSFALFRLTRPEMETGPSQRIRKILRKYYGEEKIEDISRLLTEATTADVISQDRLAWLEILKNNWNEKKALKYIQKFAANFANIYDLQDILDILKERYKKEQSQIKKIENEIHQADLRRQALKIKQKKVYQYCRNKDLIIFSQMLQKFGPYRFKLKYAWAGAELRLLNFFQEICRRINISLPDFFDLYSVKDVFDFFESGKILTKKQLKERAGCLLIRIKNKKYKAYFGEEAIKIVRAIDKAAKNTVQELKGTVAFPGYAKGRVKIVHSNDIHELGRLAKSLTKGNILVSEGTQPAMVVLMKKAGAILTEVGGITSHAAIVSREFKKPCIVGIRNLLKVLKDGDLVEVDAERGIVKIIK